jgi:hypothetical protein
MAFVSLLFDLVGCDVGGEEGPSSAIWKLEIRTTLCLNPFIVNDCTVAPSFKKVSFRFSCGLRQQEQGLGRMKRTEDAK